jgi:hypothetical protein
MVNRFNQLGGYTVHFFDASLKTHKTPRTLITENGGFWVIRIECLSEYLLCSTAGNHPPAIGCHMFNQTELLARGLEVGKWPLVR